MKIFITNQTRFSGRCARFLGAMLMAASMAAPAAIAVSPATVNLGSAANFAVLAGATVTNVVSVGTIVNGDIGSGPGTAITGFPPGIVNGTKHAGDSIAAAAKLDLTTAFNDAAGRATPAPVITQTDNIGGQTLVPGLYKSTSSLSISSGDLTLDAGGDANAVWIFQIVSTLTMTEGRKIILAGGAQAGNIFWQVGSSATLGTNSVFQGTIMADQSVTLVTGARLNGRALARIGAVTLDTNVVIKPAAADITAAKLQIETKADGSGTVVSALNIAPGDSITVYAIIRDANNDFVGNVAADSLVITNATGGVVSGDLVRSADKKSAVFTGHAIGAAEIKATYGTLSATNLGTITVSSATFVENELAPDGFSLTQNFPNPFNPSTTIQYSLANAGMVSLKVYNMVGQEVATLVNGYQEAGHYTLTFNANEGITSLSNGVYFYRLEAGSFVSMMKFVFVK